MSSYRADLCPAAQQALAVLSDFDPPWILSGRAALSWLPGIPRPISELELVWHGIDFLGSLPRQVLETLTAAGLDAAILQPGSRRVSLGARVGDSVCLVQLTAEASPPLESPTRVQLCGVSVRVEKLREVLVAALCCLHDRANLQDLENVDLLLRHGVSLELGLRDARCRNPAFLPQQLAQHLALFEISDHPEPSHLSPMKRRQAQKTLVFEIVKLSAPDSRAS